MSEQRLIDLNDRKTVHLIANLEPKYKPMDEYQHGELLKELSSVAEAFFDLPTVDAMPVVRCKDCYKAKKYGEHFECGESYMQMRPNDFCSYGERRDEVKE